MGRISPIKKDSMKQISNSNHAMLLRCIPELLKIRTNDTRIQNSIRQLIKFQKNEKLKIAKSRKPAKL